MPLNDPVPSNAPDVLLRNAQDFDKLINDQGHHTNRVGNSLPSYIQAIADLGFNPPLAFAAGIYVDSSRVTVERNGSRYFAKASATPFTTTSTFDPNQWMLFDPSFDGSAHKRQETLAATVGQTVFNVTTFSFVPNTGAISVYISGIYQDKSLYTEHPDGKGFTLLNPIAVDSVVSVEGYVIAPAVDPSVMITPEMFGAIGDGVVNDTASYQAAVTFCFDNKYTLQSNQKYLTTAPIQNLHAITHAGSGYIKRGSVTFYVSPVESQTNVLYISPIGSASNDGLSSSNPLPSLQSAFDILERRGFCDGSWVIESAAGTYTGAAAKARLGAANESETNPDLDTYTKENARFKNALVIRGQDVGYDPATNPRPIPSVIFDGAGAAEVAIQFEFNQFVIVKDIKFIDYSGSASSGALVADGWCLLRTENVHTARCTYGISGFNHSRLEIKGGSLYGSPTKQHQAVRAIFFTKIEIGNQGAGAVGQCPLISFCNVGVGLQEGSTGHCDYVSFEDNTDALRLTVNSRCNCSGSEFKRNTRAIRADSGSNVFYSSANFYTNTTDKNDENEVYQQFSSSFGGDRHSYANSGLATDYLYTPVTVTGSTNSVPTFTKTLQAGMYSPVLFSIRKPIHFRLTAWGVATGTAGAKQIKVRLGANVLGAIQINQSETGDFHVDWVGFILSPTSQTGCIRVDGHLLTSNRVNSGTGTANMQLDQNLQLEVQLTNAADSVTINGAVLEIFGA